MKPRRRRCFDPLACIRRRPWRKPPSSRSKSNRGARRLAVLLTKKSRVLVQGITGHQGQFHTRAMIDFGTKVVAGVTPGKGGTKVEGVPVFDSVREAVHRRRANASIIFVPAPYAKDAAIEAIEGGLKLVVIITERIPFHDCLDVMPYARSRGCTVIGPNCPGLASPGQAKMGIMPNQLFKEGDAGVISRSGTLTYEIVNAMTEAGFGQTTCIGIGGDPIIGTGMVDALGMFQKDRTHCRRRGNRRDRRGGGRGLHQETRDETRRGIRRRSDRAAREANGPRGRNHPRKPRHGRVEGQGIRGGGGPRRGIPSRRPEAPRSHVIERPPRNLQISACAPSPGEPRRAESLPREGETLGT